MVEQDVAEEDVAVAADEAVVDVEYHDTIYNFCVEQFRGPVIWQDPHFIIEIMK